MKDGYVALLDSGIGGISLLKELIKIMPNEKYLYFGDNDNAPYGSKNLATLRDLTLKNIDYIKQYNIKALVVACNTLSVNLLEDISAYSGLKTFGVFPPVERALMSGRNCLLLATERTAENFKNIKGITSLGLKNLASEIENNATRLNQLNVQGMFSPYKDNIKTEKGFYDVVILGCTHYFFIKDKIFDHFRPQKIIYGESFTANKVKNYFLSTKTLGNYKRKTVLFIGKNAQKNKQFYDFYS